MSTRSTGATRASPGEAARPSRPRSTRMATSLLFCFAWAVSAGCGKDGPPELPTEPLAARTTDLAGLVGDLAVEGTRPTTATLAWGQVTDGSGKEAWYELRYAPSPSAWDQAAVVTSGECASPVRGQQHGGTIACTVDGLEPGTAYDFQVSSFKRGDDPSGATARLSNLVTATTSVEASTGTDSTASDTTATGDAGTGGSTGGTDGSTGSGTAPAVAECDAPAAGWIWCDDFESDRLASYFEYDSNGGDFQRTAGVGVGASSAMRARWSQAGQVSAGNLKLAVGRAPQAYFDAADDGTRDYRELYWRFFVRNEPDWTGGGGAKLARATIFGSSTSWAQAMIAHVWSGSSPDENYLVIDPASGTDEAGVVQTTRYNDFDNLRWLGADRGSLPLFDSAHVGQWHCVEAHVRLNDPGSANGTFQLWIDGALDAERTGLNWVGTYSDYGINAVFLENYWNAGAPKAQERYLDNFVVSTEPIGCTSP